MPVFQYKAYNEAGQIKSGVEDADSARDARTSLRRKGLHVTDITDLESEGAKRSSRLRAWWISRQPASHVPQLTRQMATLLKAGGFLPIAPPLGMKEANDIIGQIHIYEFYLLALIAATHAGFHIWRHLRLRDNALRIMAPKALHKYL